MIPCKLPNYLSFFNGNTRLRSCRFDSLSLVNNLPMSRFNETILRKSFFFRVHTKWNDLPLEIRQVSDPNLFKTAVQKYMWQNLLVDIDDSDELDNFDTL